MYTILIWEPPFKEKRDLQPGKANCGWCEVVYDQNKVRIFFMVIIFDGNPKN